MSKRPAVVQSRRKLAKDKENLNVSTYARRTHTKTTKSILYFGKCKESNSGNVEIVICRSAETLKESKG